MAEAKANSWIVDDVSLSTLAYNVVDRSASWKVPAKRGENLTVPGRNGAFWIPNKPAEVGSLTLSMWAVGSLEDGSVPESGDRRRQCLENLDLLSSLFSVNHRLLNVVRVGSGAFGVQNAVTNPNFSTGTPGTATCQNAIPNASMRRQVTTPAMTNLMANPYAVTGSAAGFTQSSENLALDPFNKRDRSLAPSIMTSNYWYPASFENYSDGDTLGTLWTTAANTTATIQSAVGEPSPGGVKVFRISASTNLALNASLGVKPPFYIAPGFQPLFRVRARRSGSGNTTATRTFQVRLVTVNASAANVTTGSWQTFTLPTGTTWMDAVYDSTGLVVDGTTATDVKVEFRTGEAWSSGDGLVIDMASVSIQNTSGQSLGFWNGKAGPFFHGDSPWGGIRWNSTGNSNSISRWDANRDTRWVPSASVDASSAYYAFTDRPSTDTTGTTLSFIAMGFQTGGTQVFTHEVAAPTPGSTYQLRFTGRGLTGTTTTVEFCKQGIGDTEPVPVTGAVTITGAATATTTGTRMSGTASTFTAGSYTAAEGDRLFIRVRVPVITTGDPVFQFTGQAISDWWFLSSGDSSNTANTQYSWAGTAYNSKTIVKQRHVKRTNAVQVTTITPTGGSATVSVAETGVRIQGNESAIVLDAVTPSTPGLGFYFSTRASGNFGTDATVQNAPAPSARAGVRMLDSAGTVLGTVYGLTQLLNIESNNTVTFKTLTVTVPPSAVPNGTTQYQPIVGLVDSKIGQLLHATDFVAIGRGLPPSMIGVTDFLATATWEGTAHDSTSVHSVLFPAPWTVVDGVRMDAALAGDAGRTSLAAKSVYRNGAPLVSLSPTLSETYSVGTYTFGCEVEATPQDENSVTVSSPVTVDLQFYNGATLVNTVNLGTIGTPSGWKQLQGQVTASGSFSDLRLVFTSTATAYTMQVRMARAFLYTSTRYPAARLGINQIQNPGFIGGSGLWSSAGGLTKVNTSKGQGILLGTGSSLTSNRFPVTAGSTLQWATWGRNGLVPRIRFYNAGGALASTVTGATITQPAYTTIAAQTVTVPSEVTTAEVNFTGTGAEVSFAYVAPSFSTHEDPGTYDPTVFPFFDGNGPDLWGQPTSFTGTANASPSQVTPSVANSWLPGTDNVHVSSSTPLRPPGSSGSVGAIPRQLKGSTVSYRTLGLPRGDTTYVSGQIALSHGDGMTVTVSVYPSNSPTGAATGSAMFSRTVTTRLGQVVTWTDLPTLDSHTFVQIMVTESANAPGYRAWLDNLSVMFTQSRLGADYPGYFDGEVGGGSWLGNAGDSVSQYFGGSRRAYCEVREAIDMSSQAGGTRAEFVVDLEIISSYWEDFAEALQTFDFTNAEMLATATAYLASLTGATVGIDDSVVTLTTTGTLSDVLVTDVVSGGWIKIKGTLPPVVEINNRSFTVRDGGGLSIISSMSRGRSNVLVPLTPLSSRVGPSLSVRAAAGSGSLSLTVRARRRYAIA